MQQVQQAGFSVGDMFTQNVNIQIEALYLCEVPPHHNQYLRPFQVNTDSTAMNELNNYINSEQYLAPTQIAGMTSQILIPSPQIQTSVNITGGWFEKRFRFMMRVRFNHSPTNTVEVVTGYTDYFGLIDRGTGGIAMDEQMVFWVNSILPISEATISSPNGEGIKPIIQTPFHLYSSDKFATAPGTDHYQIMSPDNFFSRVTTATYMEPGVGHVDASAITKRYPSSAKRQYTNPSRYLGDVINTYRNSATLGNESPGVGWEGTRAYVDARAKLRGDSFSRDMFMKSLREISGDFARSYITWGEIMRMDPTIHNRVEVLLQQSRSGEVIFDAHNTEAVHGASAETQAAILTSNILPTLAMDLGLVEVAFSSTNNNINCTPTTVITNLVHLGGTGVQVGHLVNPLIDQINHELISIISANNQLYYDIDVVFNLAGNTIVKVRINSNAEKTIYRLPSFADSIISPIITAREDSFSNLVNGLSGVLHTIDSAIEANGYNTFNFNAHQPNQIDVDWQNFIHPDSGSQGNF